MRTLIVGDLKLFAAGACREAGYKMMDKAEAAVCGSGLLPNKGQRLSSVAKWLGVSPQLLRHWMKRHQSRLDAIQAERLELLGGPEYFRVCITPEGLVCSREEALCG